MAEFGVNGAAIAKRRKELGLSQAEVLERLDLLGYPKMAVEYYSRLENNKLQSSGINLKTAVFLADALDMPIKDMYIYKPNEVTLPPSLFRGQEKPVHYEKMKKRVGADLRHLRKKKKISPKTLAKQMEIDPNYVWMLENGVGAFAKLREYAKIMDYKIDEESFM